MRGDVAIQGDTSTRPSSAGNDTGSPNGFSQLDVLPSALFQEEPCTCLNTCGGTAKFFRVRYRKGMEPAMHEEHELDGDATESTSDESQLIGKDIRHARSEVEFYGKLRTAATSSPGWACFAAEAMHSPGIVQLECEGKRHKSQAHPGPAQQPAVKRSTSSGSKARYLLLLEDLNLGYDKLRFLDIKLGAETSSPGWKGKSRFRAWKNSCVDQRTNSTREGFRLEGVNNPPKALQERINGLVARYQAKHTKLVNPKRIRRFALQRLQASDFLADWLDLSELGSGAELHAHGAVWAALGGLSQLVEAIACIPVPQKWIGSSLALGMESARISPGTGVCMKVFDWGRSELTTAADHAKLAPEDRRDRLRHWKQYSRAVARFNWEMCRLALHRCCTASWAAVVFQLETEGFRFMRTAAVEGEILGVGTYPLPGGGLPSEPQDVELELAGRVGGQADDLGQPAGKLQMTVKLPHGAAAGTGSVSIRLNGAAHLRGAEVLGDTGLIFVRAVAFESAGDARRHAEARLAGQPAPLPEGRAYAQRVAPAPLQGTSVAFAEDMALVEFLGLGAEAAAEAEARLATRLPEGYLQASEIAGATAPAAWGSVFPPTMGEPTQADCASRAFSEAAFPWLCEEAAPWEH